MKKPAPQEIEISQEDVALIMGDNYVHFDRIRENTFCSKCDNPATTIVMYRAYLNTSQDIILHGQCARCGHRVGRYIETGENKEKAAVAKHILEIIKNYRT